MYLFIFEDGSFKRSDDYCQGDLNAVNEGMLGLIDTENMTEYYGGEWNDIPSVHD